jgi:hypothetical protein
MVDMLGSRDGADHEVARIVLVLALSSLSLEEDRTRPSLWPNRVELVAPCRPSLSAAEMAWKPGWRIAEAGKLKLDRNLEKAPRSDWLEQDATLRPACSTAQNP